MKVIAALLLTLLVSLARAESPSHLDIVGAWTTTKGEIVNDVIYSENGTFRGILKNSTTTLWKYAGTWTITDQRLRYTYTESDSTRVPVGLSDEDKILEIDKQHFLLKTSQGNERIYKRIKK